MARAGETVGETARAPAAESGAVGPADYFALLKPRVMSLVCFTGLVGIVVAPAAPHPVIALTALLCIAVGAGAAGAVNMWCDRDIDAIMDRTRDRPIPAGRVAPEAALGFGVTLAVGAVATMALAVNWPAAALLALAIGIYVFVYTVGLKRRTPQNIVIGGAAGALPPTIGWAAATGETALAAGARGRRSRRRRAATGRRSPRRGRTGSLRRRRSRRRKRPRTTPKRTSPPRR